jgi:hypothetical protein
MKQRTLSLNRIDKTLAIILLIYLCFSFFMIKKFPRVWIDTAWCSIAPYTLATEGKLANPLLKGKFEGLTEHLLTPQVAHKVLLAGVYEIFGFGLVQSRALSIFAGFCLIVATFCFARKYYDVTTAALAAILLATDNVFFVTARSIREDILVAFFAMTGFFLFIHALHNGSLKFHALSGAFIGVSLYTHPNSFLVLIAIVILYFARYRLSVILAKEFWVFSLFCLVGFLPYALYVIREDSGNNFSHFLSQVGRNTEYIKRDFLKDFLNEYRRYDNYIYFPNRLLIFLVQAGVLIYAFLSKRKVDRYILALIVTFVLLLPFWNPGNTTSRYFIVFIPALCILVSASFLDFFRSINTSAVSALKFQSKLKYTMMGLLFALFLVNQTAGDIYILWKHRDNDFNRFISQIRSTIPENTRIWGSLTFWMGLHTYPYLSQISPYEEVLRFRPEYAILYDSETWGDVSATVGRKANTAQAWAEIRTKMEKLCEQRGTAIKQIHNKFYGDIVIYRINWNNTQVAQKTP